jgi:hypothetical protein
MNWYKRAKSVPGGIADDRSPSDFDPALIEEGLEVEKEHTTDKEIAQEIVMDHLMESDEYYHELKEMEKGLEKNF